MTVQKKRQLILIVLIALAGVLRLADLLFFTDAATGFFTDPHTLLRYLVLLVPVVYIFAAAPAQVASVGTEVSADGIRRFGYGAAAVGCALGGVGTVVFFLMGKMRIFPACVSLLLAAGGMGLVRPLWKKKTSPFWNFILCFGAFGVTLHHFLTHSSTWYRMGTIIILLASVAGMLFLVEFFTLESGRPAVKAARSIYRFGMLAFYFDSVLLLPQLLWNLYTAVVFDAFTCAASVSLLGIGILGLASARYALRLSE